MKLHVIEAADFIKSTPAGELDLEASKAVLDRVCSAVKDLDEHLILIDLRKAKSVLSTVDVWYLAEELGKYGECFRRKTAILLREEGSADQARFFELTAQNRGHEVQVFVDFEQAVYWLGTVEEIDRPSSNTA